MPFAPVFRFGDVISSALQPWISVAEIPVTVNGSQIYRPHRDELPSRGGVSDGYEGIETFEIPGTGDTPAAVGWVLHHGYRGALPPSSAVGGLRLQCGNMQVGESSLLDFVFPEPRFNAWAVGEFHILDPRIIPNGRRDHFETTARFHDLVNQIVPIARSIATWCRTSSLLRKWERDFEENSATATKHLAILRQNVASDAMIEDSRDALERALQMMEKIASREQIHATLRRKMQKRIAALRRRVSIPRSTPRALHSLPSLERQGYADCFELIYECSTDPTQAKTLIDRILQRLARRRR